MVAIFLAQGFEEIEAVTVYDILKRADIETIFVGIGSDQITGTHGLKISVDFEIRKLDASMVDMIVLPGGMPGTKNLEASRELMDMIKQMHNENKKIAAICAAPSILGKLGMLENIEATCFPGFERFLSGAVISRKTVITDENITTSKGPGTAFSFALEIVRLLKGEKKANEIAGLMQYKER